MSPPPPDRQPLSHFDADEQEFQAFAQAQDPLDMEAAVWAVRRRSGLDAEGEAALQNWLSANPGHACAVDEMDALLGGMQHFSREDVAAFKAGVPQAPQGSVVVSGAQMWPDAAVHASGGRPSGAGRRALLQRTGVAAMAFVVVCSGWMGWGHWRQQPLFEQVFASGRGQQRTVYLPDGEAEGSTLQLDTATRLRARLYRDRREVLLEDGQAMFVVKSDRERPFHVWAGGLRITVVGTRFSVRRTVTGLDAGQTVVSVEEGRVRVTRASVAAADAGGVGAGAGAGAPTVEAGADTVELVAGQMVAADATGQMGRVSRLSASAIAPWREGRISFDQVPLAQAIAEFERYGPTGLVVNDPVLAAMPVGGSYSRKQWQHFAQSLAQVLPVRLVQRAGYIEVVALPRGD